MARIQYFHCQGLGLIPGQGSLSLKASLMTQLEKNPPAMQETPIQFLFASGGQSIRVSASASVLPMNTQD